MRRDAILLAPRGVMRTLWLEVRAIDENNPGSPNAQAARPWLSQVTGEYYREPSAATWVFNALMTDQEIADFDAFAPGTTFVLWVGDKDGSPDGVTLSLDDDGNELVTGAATFPGSTVYQGRTRLTWLLDASPDEDDPPARPSAATQVHTFLGWARRRFDLI